MITRIAHRLAFQCRYNGDTKRMYCVAEHSIHMAEEAAAHDAPPVVQLATLLHDAPEHVTGDLVPDVKKHPVIAPIIAEMERDEWHDMNHVLRLNPSIQRIATGQAVKLLDRSIAAAESVTVAFPQIDWTPFTNSDKLHVSFRDRINAATADHKRRPEFFWRDRFIRMFHELVSQL